MSCTAAVPFSGSYPWNPAPCWFCRAITGPRQLCVARLYKGWRGGRFAALPATMCTSAIWTFEYSYPFECFTGFPFSGLTLCYLDIKSSIPLSLNLSAFPPFSSLPLSPCSRAASRNSKFFPPHWGRCSPVHLAWIWVPTLNTETSQGLTQTENHFPSDKIRHFSRTGRWQQLVLVLKSKIFISHHTNK